MSAQIQIDPMLLLEAKLVKALEDKKAQGWKIKPAQFYAPNECMCCLLGSIVDRIVYPYYEPAAEKLRILGVQAQALEYGFMGSSHHESFQSDPSNIPFVQLGAKLRAQYVNL